MLFIYFVMFQNVSSANARDGWETPCSENWTTYDTISLYDV